MFDIQEQYIFNPTPNIREVDLRQLPRLPMVNLPQEIAHFGEYIALFIINSAVLDQRKSPARTLFVNLLFDNQFNNDVFNEVYVRTCSYITFKIISERIDTRSLSEDILISMIMGFITLYVSSLIFKFIPLHQYYQNPNLQNEYRKAENNFALYQELCNVMSQQTSSFRGGVSQNVGYGRNMGAVPSYGNSILNNQRDSDHRQQGRSMMPQQQNTSRLTTLSQLVKRPEETEKPKVTQIQNNPHRQFVNVQKGVDNPYSKNLDYILFGTTVSLSDAALKSAIKSIIVGDFSVIKHEEKPLGGDSSIKSSVRDLMNVAINDETHYFFSRKFYSIEAITIIESGTIIKAIKTQLEEILAIQTPSKLANRLRNVAIPTSRYVGKKFAYIITNIDRILTDFLNSYIHRHYSEVTTLWVENFSTDYDDAVISLNKIDPDFDAKFYKEYKNTLGFNLIVISSNDEDVLESEGDASELTDSDDPCELELQVSEVHHITYVAANSATLGVVSTPSPMVNERYYVDSKEHPSAHAFFNNLMRNADLNNEDPDGCGVGENKIFSTSDGKTYVMWGGDTNNNSDKIWFTQI